MENKNPAKGLLQLSYGVRDGTGRDTPEMSLPANIETDPQLLEQVIINLDVSIGNAR